MLTQLSMTEGGRPPYVRTFQGVGYFGPSYKDKREIARFDAIVAAQRDQNVAYVFWTGGFDSTYVVLRLLLDEKRIVQPLYLRGTVDSGLYKGIHRGNRPSEANARQQVREAIATQFPTRAADLLPVFEFDYMPKDKHITAAIQNLQLFPNPFNQYEAMARLAVFYGIHVHIGVIGIEGEAGAPLPRDPWGTHLRQALLRPANPFVTTEVRLADPSHPMRNLIFPTAFTSKRRALVDAEAKGYADILRLSWTCWYPRDGKACRACEMCRSRVIPHPGDAPDEPPSAQAKLQALLRHLKTAQQRSTK